MQTNGFIVLHRQLMSKPIWQCSTPEQKVILITLLMMANFAPNEWEWKGQKFRVEPGQFITSLDNIKKAAGDGISIKNIRTALVRFEKYEFLANESTKQGRLITIVNWGLYQSLDERVAKETANGWQTGGKRVATNNKDNKDNNYYTATADEKFAKVFEQEFARLISPSEHSTLQAFIEEGLPEKLVCEGIRKARIGGHVDVKYVSGILKDWHGKQFTTVEQIEAEDREFKDRKDKPRKQTGQAKPKSTVNQYGEDKFALLGM